MEGIKEKKINRFRFLKRLYELTNGSPNESANMFEVGNQLGFEQKETENITDYLVGEGFVEYQALGGKIGLRHSGTVEVEEFLARSEGADYAQLTERMHDMTEGEYEIRILEKLQDVIGKGQYAPNKLFAEGEFPDRELLQAILLKYQDNKEIAIVHTTGIPKIVDMIVPQYGCILRLNELKKQVENERRDGLMISNEHRDIAPFIESFSRDYPNRAQVGFIMMQFHNTPAHQAILVAIKQTLDEVGLKGLRADDKQYSDDLLDNIRTYMHCCGFGVAVFERILSDDFNPNVSLEVGYMIALGKPVCLLKDKTLKNLQSDIVGRLYKNFDPQDVENTLPKEMKKWLIDKGISSPMKK